MIISITIPQDKETEIANAFAKQFSYSPTASDIDGNQIPNPTSKKQFIKEQLSKFIKDVYRQYKLDEVDVQKAQTAIDADILSNSIIIN
jgi:hypothetical protein